ncbi:RtcB family protein [Brachybacterium hainanense]|uniref:3'-phosphate/5'-hydroxy nucleic acid ligase n=1 Tax=Brachybacterium hainanense TaxID=1541174 RepID=A0ABV6R8J4_9MICO
MTAASANLPTTLPGTAAPVRMWLPEQEVEPAALQQLRTIADLPWVHGLRVMPDCHLGKGATVGSVIAMRGAVSPAAVGVDIGCGVAALRTDLVDDDLEDLHALRSAIEAAIPVGFHEHSAPIGDGMLTQLGVRAGTDRFWDGFAALPEKVLGREAKARRQLGTMGGGNHFAELCVDARDSRVWITLHSGSRNIGKEIAEVHIARARGLEHNRHLADRDLAVFLADTPGMDDYVRDVHWAQEYAARSRAIMIGLLRAEVARHWAARGREVAFDLPINCHHNYISIEQIDGEHMIVTRKGAISTREGGLALIPGSMGVGSYIVRGLANPDSFCSASHGAGRRMSRTAARRSFTREDLLAQTEGVECRKDTGVIDEIPGAYKDLHAVMRYQSDLVEPIAHLQTVLCVKG